MFAKLITTGRMIKFSHSVFAFPFACVGVVLAWLDTGAGHISIGNIGLWILCMICARAFAMTFNRIVDKQIDALNPRTKDRELPRGKVSMAFAAKFLFACATAFLISAYLFWPLYKNPWPMFFAIPLLAFLAAYSYTKRFTWLSHFWLGASLGLAPLASYIAFIVPPFAHLLSMPVVLIGLAVTFWTAGFDIIYSLADFDFDRRQGLYSIPARFGIKAARIISICCHLLTLVLLTLIACAYHFGAPYHAALILAAVMFFIEHALVAKNLKYINAAFFTVNGLFSIVFAALLILDRLIAAGAIKSIW